MALRNNVKTDQMTKSDPREVQNNAGGYVYKLNDKDRFVRALTLGSDQGTYYVNANKMATDTVLFMKEYIANNGVEAVKTIVEISDSGRASKNTYAIFALAVALNDQNVETKIAAREAVNKVCRTFFHLSELAADLEALDAGWGPAKVKAIANWYESKNSNQLALQAVKYRSRNGYTHRDMLRISHPKLSDNNLTNFVLNLAGAEKEFDSAQLPAVAQNYLALSKIDNVKDAVAFIKDSDDTVAWEFLQTELLNSAEVWAALLDCDMVGYTALLRNLNRFLKNGLFDLDNYQFLVAERLEDKDRIVKSRIHPMNIISALRANSKSRYWEAPVNTLPEAIVSALENALELSFKNVDASGKVFYLGVDVSSSMGTPINSSDWGNSSGKVSCRDFAALLSTMIAKKEKKSYIKGFTNSLTNLPITRNDSFNTVVKKMSNLPFGSTDCAQPILDALERNLYVDEFVVITDNETWAGKVKVVDTLADYRKKVNPNARFVVVACTPTEFSVGDPSDKWTLNISGADSAVLSLITDFAKD